MLTLSITLIILAYRRYVGLSTLSGNRESNMKISQKLKLNTLIVLALLVLNITVAVFLVQRMMGDVRQLAEVSDELRIDKRGRMMANILVVDDDKSIRISLREFLTDADYDGEE